MRISARGFCASHAITLLRAVAFSVASLALGAQGANQAPTATITSPSNGTTVNAPGSFSLTATASDQDGSIKRVEYYAGTTLIGSATAAPYAVTWANVAAGSYVLTAKPIDNLDKAGTSNTVQVTVNAVTTFITSPASGATVTAGPVQVNGTFSGPTNSSILVTGGANDTVMATVGSGTFGASVAMVEGLNVIEVQVARPDGTSQVVTSTVNGTSRPVVAITGPANRGPYCLPATLTITAEAATGQGTIDHVDFLDNDVKCGNSSTSPPYSGSCTLTTGDSHRIVARAVNSAGLSTESASLMLSAGSQRPTIAIRDPAAGSSFKVGTAIAVTAIASDADGTVARVDYLFPAVPASSTTPPYSSIWTPSTKGNYQLVGRATDNCGVTGDSPQVVVSITNDDPTVQLTSPSGNVNAFAPAQVELAATATDPEGIAKVEFISNGAVIYTAMTAPYTYQLASLGVGNYTVAAKAYDNFDGAATSASRVVSVTAAPANQPPTVTLTAPANNATFTAPVDIVLTATASDPDSGGSVAQVEFLDGATVLRTVTSAPYTYTWSNQTLGTHTITARATDNLGATASASATITVNGSVASITQPSNGYRTAAPATYDIVASVSTTAGTITTAEILDGQTVIATAIVNLPAASFSFLYANVGAGTHIHTIRAMHSNGSTVLSAPVTVEVFTPPSVALSSPTANEFFIAPAAVGLTAETAGFPQPISSVQFFSGSQLIGERVAPPYEVLWNNLAPGTYQVRATATDSSGNVATSAISSITVAAAPSLHLAAGLDGSSTVDDNTSLTGHVDAPVNTTILVNGLPASIDASGNWHIDGVPLAAGSNALTITLRTIGAADVSQSVSITSFGVKPFELVVSPAQGMSPLTVYASLRQRGTAQTARVEFDADSDGISETTVTQFSDGEAQAAFSYTSGTYTLTARAYDAANNLLYVATRKVVVDNPEFLRRRAGSVYQGMVGRLMAGDAAGALEAISDETKSIFQRVFSDLGADIPTIASQLGRAEVRTVADNMAEMAVFRDTAQGTKVFIVLLFKDSDGLWRIQGM
jgi:Big-like domain-containing protein/glucodextranase-like protein